MEDNADKVQGIEVGLIMEDNHLILNFGASVSWIGMTKEDALKFAQLIIEGALQLPEPPPSDVH